MEDIVSELQDLWRQTETFQSSGGESDQGETRQLVSDL